MKPAGYRCGRRAGSFQLGKRNDITTWHWHIWHIFYISMHQTEFWTRRNLMANAFFSSCVCGGDFSTYPWRLLKMFNAEKKKMKQEKRRKKWVGYNGPPCVLLFFLFFFPVLLPLCRLGSFCFSPFSPFVIASWWGSSIFQRWLPGMPALMINGHHSPSSAVVWLLPFLFWILFGCAPSYYDALRG